MANGNADMIERAEAPWTSPGFEEAYPFSLRHLQTPSFAIPICKVNLSKKVCEKFIQLIETFPDTRIELLRAARRTPLMDEKITEDERKRSAQFPQKSLLSLSNTAANSQRCPTRSGIWSSSDLTSARFMSCS